jgi:hypothetical protein
MSSDYAIAQFRFLTRLLLVHGHYSYIRNASMIVNFFYKNMIGVGVLFWFQFFCGYTTASIFEFTYILLWNVAFTCFSVLAIGIFDRDVPDRVAIQVPELYRWGLERRAFTLARFVMYMLESVYQSLICFFVPYFAYRLGSVNSEGRQPDNLEIGTTMAIACVTMANLFIGFNMKSWTIIHHVTVWASIALMYIYVAVYSLLPFSSVYGFEEVVYGGAVFWLCIALIIVVAFLPRYIYRYCQRTFYPRDVDIIRELVKIKPPDYDFLSDRKVNPTIPVSRSSTLDTVLRLERPVINSSPRPSFTTDRTMQPLSLSSMPPANSECPLREMSEGCIVTHMQTGVIAPMRGYAFAQEAGTGRAIMGTLRRMKTNPMLINRVSAAEFRAASLRRRSLPDVRAAKDVTDITDGEKTRMVTFPESTASSTTTTAYSSRRQSEFALEGLPGHQTEATGVTDNNNDENRFLSSVIENVNNEDNVVGNIIDCTSSENNTRIENEDNSINSDTVV